MTATTYPRTTLPAGRTRINTTTEPESGTTLYRTETPGQRGWEPAPGWPGAWRTTRQFI